MSFSYYVTGIIKTMRGEYVERLLLNIKKENLNGFLDLLNLSALFNFKYIFFMNPGEALF